MTWVIAASVIGALLAIIGTLIVLNLRSIKCGMGKLFKEIEKHDNKIESLEKAQAICMQDCSRNYVSKEDWLREAGFVRERMEDVSKTLNRMEGKMTVMEKMPEICGNIAREIGREFNKGQK